MEEDMDLSKPPSDDISLDEWEEYSQKAKRRLISQAQQLKKKDEEVKKKDEEVKKERERADNNEKRADNNEKRADNNEKEAKRARLDVDRKDEELNDLAAELEVTLHFPSSPF